MAQHWNGKWHNLGGQIWDQLIHHIHVQPKMALCIATKRYSKVSLPLYVCTVIYITTNCLACIANYDCIYNIYYLVHLHFSTILRGNSLFFTINIVHILFTNIQQHKTGCQAKQCLPTWPVWQQRLASCPEQNRAKVEEKGAKDTVQDAAVDWCLSQVIASKQVQPNTNVSVEPETVGNHYISAVEHTAKT